MPVLAPSLWHSLNANLGFACEFQSHDPWRNPYRRQNQRFIGAEPREQAQQLLTPKMSTWRHTLARPGLAHVDIFRGYARRPNPMPDIKRTVDIFL